MQNSVLRNILGKALEEFPSSPPLLLLFSDIEVRTKNPVWHSFCKQNINILNCSPLKLQSQCSVAGKLWRSMVSVIKQESTPAIATLHWAPLFMCLALAKRIEEIERDSEIAIDSFGLGTST